ncbi:LysR family transcriptional regulator [Arthrobacter sp. StoSoilB5]|uniref:LysR family transcriptional regulator n=1 Tax=Arthrobacter sp. StoSoilB5 TaxID=2830992 RepID=UPI001CC382B3|nr:LysR family transcriptional regulator [Arthrobacter sp. StoSoilB5]BCW45085.1 LysR family transcriptional regulator [Arthrobacter sp. StoSoilB5]
MINVQRLRLLRELSFLGTISAVADSLGLTRPAVSQQLSQLEKDTGLVLVERAGRSVQLTGAGLRLVEQSHEVFESLERIDAEIAVSRNSISGDLRISAFPSFASTVLPTTISLLRSSHPQLKVFMFEHEPAEGMVDLMTKRADVAVLDNLSRQDPRNEAVSYQPLFGDDFYVVMSEKHPFRKLDTVPLAHLAEEEWALNRSARIYHSSIVDACLAEGFSPNITCDCRDTTTVLQMVRAGLAISVLPGLALTGHQQGLSVRPLTPLLKREVLFATLKGRSSHPAIQECFRAMRSAYARRVQSSFRGFALDQEDDL